MSGSLDFQFLYEELLPSDHALKTFRCNPNQPLLVLKAVYGGQVNMVLPAVALGFPPGHGRIDKSNQAHRAVLTGEHLAQAFPESGRLIHTPLWTSLHTPRPCCPATGALARTSSSAQRCPPRCQVTVLHDFRLGSWEFGGWEGGVEASEGVAPQRIIWHHEEISNKRVLKEPAQGLVQEVAQVVVGYDHAVRLLSQLQHEPVVERGQRKVLIRRWPRFQKCWTARAIPRHEKKWPRP
ncbi:hypothetical protein CRUP_004396 [Coryphaenoides rupestris]|nr:hypothetical protein CRUP_004396 [Coryphaenoides rupestris]